MKVAADEVIYLGAMVAANVDGFAAAAANNDDHVVIGVAQEHVDNRESGDGARTVRVQKGVFGMRNSADVPVTQAEIR